MPVVRNLAQRYEKFRAKTAPDRVGSRYDASKSIALERYLEGVTPSVSLREQARSLLDTLGVPAGHWAVYLSFIQHLSTKINKYDSATFDRFVSAVKLNWTIRGADPAVLDKLIMLVRGRVPT